MLKKKKLLLLAVFLNLVPSFCLAAFSYTPMESIPGFGRPTDFAGYVMAIYKFGIWTIGLAALLMIMIGGYMYLTSAGNTSQAGKAKDIITDAIAGIILVFVSWLLLYTINPELVKINSLESAVEKAARNYTGSYPTITSTMPSDCKSDEWQTIFNDVASSSGVDKCILQALTAIESGCTQVPNRTFGGRDCSAVQINAGDLCKSYGDCNVLEADPKKALECAASYLKACSSKYRNSPDEQKIRDAYAGYNGGCGALFASNSCGEDMKNDYGNSYLKWDCPKQCGGYCPVPARTTVFLNYYNQCKGS